MSFVRALAFVSSVSLLACGGNDPNRLSQSVNGDSDAGPNVVSAVGSSPSPQDADAGSVSTGDASASAGPSSAADGGAPNDAATGSSADGSTAAEAGPGAQDAAADASEAPGPGGGGCTPPNGNFAFCGTATATSSASTMYPATAVNDGALGTLWLSASGSCVLATTYFAGCGTSTYVDIALDQARTIGRVKVYGIRGTAQSWNDPLSVRIELRSAAGAVLATADVVSTRGAEPNGDADHVFSAPVALVKTVRVYILSARTTSPGLGEIEAYAN